MSDLPATKQSARELNVSRYFTGKACQRGHICARYSSTGHCVECIAVVGKEWRQGEGKEKSETYRAVYRKSEAGRKTSQKYNQSEKGRKRAATWQLTKYHTDPQYRALCGLRARLRAAFSAQKVQKSSRFFDLTGCTYAELIDHLTAQFQPGMTLDNLGRGSGKWQIDHIRPCCSFNLLDPAQQQECFHYTNLQPL